MNKQLYGVFPVPVLTVKDFITEEERVTLLKEISSIDHSNHNALDGNASSTHSFDSKIIHRLAFKLDMLKDFKERLNNELNEFAKIYGLGKVELENSWSNKQGKGSSLRRHCHPNSKISGALYINVDQDSSKLVFFNTNPYVKYEDYEELTEFNWTTFYIQPVNCELVLFPSWLEHGSNEEVNNSEERVVISFNSKQV